jgi:hypothetical protein
MTVFIHTSLNMGVSAESLDDPMLNYPEPPYRVHLNTTAATRHRKIIVAFALPIILVSIIVIFGLSFLFAGSPMDPNIYVDDDGRKRKMYPEYIQPTSRQTCDLDAITAITGEVELRNVYKCTSIKRK